MGTAIKGRVASLLSDAILFMLGCITGTIAVAFLSFFVSLWVKISVFMWGLFF
jgi:hypothetical protein